MTKGIVGEIAAIGYHLLNVVLHGKLTSTAYSLTCLGGSFDGSYQGICLTVPSMPLKNQNKLNRVEYKCNNNKISKESYIDENKR